MTQVFSSLDEVKGALGVEVGPGPALVVDQERVDAFAAATGDHQWIHVNPGRAHEGPFGGPVAHGYLTLSLIPYFAQQLFRLEIGSARLNYGVNRARFPAPVRVGRALRATATFVDLQEGPAGAALTTRYVLRAEGSDRPACVAETLVLIR